MKGLLCALFLLSPLIRTNCASLGVAELMDHIRTNTVQKETQVMATRKALTGYEWLHFSEGVKMVDGYQRFVLGVKEKLITASNSAPQHCVESLPKPINSLLRTADWDIEMCIGHMAVYGERLVEDSESEVQGFNEIASRHPINANRDFFLTDWNSGAGVEATQHLQQTQMQQWDNISSVDLFELKKRVEDTFRSMAAHEWPLCVNYGEIEVERLFNEAISHLQECGQAPT